MLVAVGAATTVSILFWDTGRDWDEPLSTEPATVFPNPKSVRLTKADHDAAIKAAARFVSTAVKREHTGDSYGLVTAALRQGMTRAQWAKGNIPVQYYPVDAARWKLDYTYEQEVGLQVYVLPERGESLRPMVFLLTMKAQGTKDARRWLVDSFVPSSAGIDQAAPGNFVPTPRGGGDAATGSSAPLGAAWLALPGVLLGLLLLVPAVLVVREKRRSRRAQRDYLASLK